jgi:ribosomal protein L31
MKDVDVKRINAIINSHPMYVKGSRSELNPYGKVQIFERKESRTSVGSQPHLVG